MSIEQLTSIEEQFTRHLQTIRDQSKKLSKSQTLRVGAWLKKLCSVVDNYFWRKNRNLYAEVLSLMLKQGDLEAPFDKSPPEGSLVRLTLYQIPFSIRQKLQCNKAKNQDKQNNLQLSNLTMNKIGSADLNNLRTKKRQSFVLKSLKSINDNAEIDPELFQFEHKNKQNLSQTQKRIQKCSKANKKYCDDKVLQTIEQVLYFLAKNNQKFMQDCQYAQLLSEIVAYGDQQGKNFKELKFSCIQQKL